MPSSRDHFDSFEDHTRLKHAILRSYLQYWASILLSARAGNPEVCFIDCFAGPGHDGEGHEGSPLIAARAVQVIRGMSTAGSLPAGASLRFAAVEKKAIYFREMKESVESLLGSDPAVRLLNHDYREVLGELQSFRGTAPTLTFLDPFGVSGLEASAFAGFMAGQKSEILILVSGIGAARLHGVLEADSQHLDEALEGVRNSPTLFPELQGQEEARLQQERDEYVEALDSTRPAAHAALLRALGSEDALIRLQQAPLADRPRAFVQEIARLLFSVGATRVLSIPMRDNEGIYKYTLLHGSKSPRAFSAMKTAVSGELKREELSAEMRARIRADLSVPLSPYLDWLTQKLSGTGEFWAYDRKQRRIPSLQETLRETTILFDFQLQDLKRLMKQRGLLTKREGREWVAFP